jgi:hypothetical protein
MMTHSTGLIRLSAGTTFAPSRSRSSEMAPSTARQRAELPPARTTKPRPRSCFADTKHNLDLEAEHLQIRPGGRDGDNRRCDGHPSGDQIKRGARLA